MMTTSIRISGFLLSPPLRSAKLDHAPRISFLKPLKSRQARSVSVVKANFPNYCTKAALNGNLETVGVPTSVPVRVAHELLLAGHRYLDVRTPEEFNAGHAPGAINVPYMYRVGSGMTKNANFVAEVSSHFRKDDEIIVGCQLGKRSMMAATDLLVAGFSGITDIAGGFAAWTQNGLPTEQ
ncbi:thiosulfate sulfurtransferase 16, chloroplastic-like [Neltuma alba]|uniref:thiosulfate sulfurtransferase 16, chloroplastic-like n=1 Tax=Neltuma alba TaxID=207710 RepID=UPI0010A53ED7|nr:thiosulfate sulfurtransferase 16, chloroplastic-like [Prosopis alba]XP_028783298.1 thiosulfate sulfurtransferase 16, chloroplastic-like [Prosopis alba]